MFNIRLKICSLNFCKVYFSLAESLLKNLQNSPSKFDMSSVHQYYKNLEPSDNFNYN